MDAMEIRKRIDELEEKKKKATSKDKERIGDMIGILEQIFEDKRLG